MLRWALALAAVLLVQPAVAREAHWWESGPALPTSTGRITDQAELLPAAARKALSLRLAALEQTTGHQFVILTVADLQGQSIEDFGVRVGRSWGVGRKAGDGVLLIVAPSEHKVRIEVGLGLERRLSDPICAKIIRDEILPFFRRGDMVGGIRSGAIAIIARLGNRAAH